MALSKEQSVVLKSFGANLRRVRVQARMTQAKFAELTDVELRTEQKWEKGEINVPLTTLARVQAVLGCTWDSLLGEAVCRGGVTAKGIGIPRREPRGHEVRGVSPIGQKTHPRLDTNPELAG